MAEIIGSIQLQGEFTSRIFVEAIAEWQTKSEIGNVVNSSTINALGMCKTFSNNILMLIETTVENYFRQLGIYIANTQGNFEKLIVSFWLFRYTKLYTDVAKCFGTSWTKFTNI